LLGLHDTTLRDPEVLQQRQLCGFRRKNNYIDRVPLKKLEYHLDGGVADAMEQHPA
jgi:hypothetical protein